MRIILDSTETIKNIRGIECRLWKGETSYGEPIEAFISAIVISADSDIELINHCKKELLTLSMQEVLGSHK